MQTYTKLFNFSPYQITLTHFCERRKLIIIKTMAQLYPFDANFNKANKPLHLI